MRALETDHVDVLDLDRAGGLIRYCAARDAKVLVERSPGEFQRFALSAIRFWLDAEHAVRAGYAKISENLGP